MDLSVVHQQAEEFQRTRTQTYQSFKVAGVEYEGMLHDSRGTLVKSVSLSEQIQYLHFDSVDFKGHSVLDIGCNIGAFSLEAIERGATRVTAVDVASACVREAKMLKTIAMQVLPQADVLSIQR